MQGDMASAIRNACRMLASVEPTNEPMSEPMSSTKAITGSGASMGGTGERRSISVVGVGLWAAAR